MALSDYSIKEIKAFNLFSLIGCWPQCLPSNQCCCPLWVGQSRTSLIWCKPFIITITATIITIIITVT